MMGTKTIRQAVFLDARPEEVYEAFTDASKHSGFTGAKATCDPKVGGKFTAWDGYICGKNLELEKGKRIVQEWKTSEWPDAGPSIVEFTFTKKGKGTELVMAHSKVPSSQAEAYRKGWIEFYWEPLKKYFGKKAK